MDRRHFLRGLGCSAMTSTTLYSSLVHLGAMSTASAQGLPVGDDYRALVCILLAGGNDSFNLLVPTTGEEYAEYRGIRGDLALRQEELLPLTPTEEGGKTFGVHPGAPELQQLYGQRDLAFVANVGTLVEPLTPAAVASGTARLPLGLYSHADQIAQWQTALPDQRTAVGWGGRLADLMGEALTDERVSMSISFNGANLFQAGRTTAEHAVSTGGRIPPGLWVYGAVDSGDLPKTIDSMLEQEYENLFELAYARKLRRSIDADIFFRAAVEQVSLETPFPESDLGRGLEGAARAIAARGKLGARRQTFFLSVGGWDHHDELLNNQARMIPEVSRALSAFHAALEEIGMLDEVTTFTISDFGRTLTTNGRGSDHGWGGNQLVMGGAVRGGRLYGEYPALYAGAPLDTGRGRLIPTTSVDAMFAELALWFGVDPSALDMVLPNVGRFLDPRSSDAPLGFLL